MSDKPEKPTGTTVRRRVDGFVVTMACLGAIIGFLIFPGPLFSILGIESFNSLAVSLITWVAAPLIGVAIYGGVTYFLRRTFLHWIFLVLIALLIFVGYFFRDGMSGEHARNSKVAAADNSLRAIYLMQQDYYSENKSYYTTSTGNQTRQINDILFDGNKTLNETGDYVYFILRSGSSGYRAHATAFRLQNRCIDHLNILVDC